MRDYAGIISQIRIAAIGVKKQSNRLTMMQDAADAIEELLARLERYRHAAFVISETCVEESKCHISPEEAIKKIRENIYYFRQMPLPEPPKEVVQGEP